MNKGGYYMGVCISCGQKRKETNMYFGDDGEPFCESCYEIMSTTCHCCGEVDFQMISDDQGRYFCEECVDYRAEDPFEFICDTGEVTRDTCKTARDYTGR